MCPKTLDLAATAATAPAAHAAGRAAQTSLHGSTIQGADLLPLWSVDDVAAYLGVPVKTVYEWRSTGRGPKGFRVGRYVRFRPEAVQAWLDDQAAAEDAR